MKTIQPVANKTTFIFKSGKSNCFIFGIVTVQLVRTFALILRILKFVDKSGHNFISIYDNVVIWSE